MNKYQYGLIKNAFRYDMLEYHKEYYNTPWMRMQISELLFKGKGMLLLYGLYQLYSLTKQRTIYNLFVFDTGKSWSTYIITKDDIVIFWCTSYTFSEASNAFHFITEVYPGYGEGKRNSSWTWVSADDFDCISAFWDRRDIIKYCEYTFTSYQLTMFEKTNRYYIDKLIVDKETAAIAADNLNKR